MTKGQHSFVQHLQTLFDAGTIGELTDRQLLERFTTRDEETAERAFAVLIKRHGPMVFHACRAILQDEHEAEAAFQATFLILARRSSALWVWNSLGPWLFQVARRVAACARTHALRRRALERRAAKLAVFTEDHASWDDRAEVIHEEVNRLPAKDRAAVVLSDLEGLTQEQAAHQLGWSAGTVRSRLARGRQRLRDHLTRRGLAPAAIPLVASSARGATAIAWPRPLAEMMVQTVVQLAAGRAVTGPMASAFALAEGALKVMLWSQLKLIAATVLAFGLVAGTALLGHQAMGLRQAPPATAKRKPQPKDQVGAHGGPTAPARPGPESLSPNARARLDVAKRLRDAMFRHWQGGAISVMDYLAWQRRYNDVVGDVMVQSDADRVLFLEHRVATLKRIEQRLRELDNLGQVKQTELLVAALDRLEAEDAWEKARAKLKVGGTAAGDQVSSQLKELLNPQPRPAVAPAAPTSTPPP